MNKITRDYLLQDSLIIIFSILVAIILIKTHVLISLLQSTQNYELFGSFFAGLFFTSIFTTAPSIIALAEISQIQPIFYVAFFGALGALAGDLIIFQFVRDRLSEHLLGLMKHKIDGAKVTLKHHLKFLKWISFFIGGLIIASPLPDEIGIGLLGLSKMNMKWFIPVAFLGNFFGILMIALFANAFMN